MITSTEYHRALNLFIATGDAESVREAFSDHPEVEALIRFCKGEHGNDPKGIPSVTKLKKYIPPKDSEYWPAVWGLHRNKKKWSDKSLGELDKSTNRIMAHLTNKPHRSSYGHYGLVVGYVQSGKTSNYTALCAKAADNGYNLIIILSGLYNDLRAQTQARLLKELTGTMRDRRDGIHILGDEFQIPWRDITKLDKDFHNLDEKILQPISDTGRPHLIVTKKNTAPLDALRKWIENTPVNVQAQIKALIIDDEADHGSIDTQTGEKWDNESSSFQRSESEINRRLRLLLRSLKGRFSYVGYTATPLANVFINPEVDDERILGPPLYPNDFIISLEEPEGYCGINKIHPQGEISPYLVRVPNSEAKVLREIADNRLKIDKTPLPWSLERAMIQYIISWAIRCMRDQRQMHHSMLIHVKHTIESMTPLVRKVNEKLQQWEVLLSNAYDEEADVLRSTFKRVWEESYKDKLDVKFKQPEWNGVLRECKRIMSQNKPDIVEINYESKDALEYDTNHESGWRALVIGGTRLSRELTLEGLCVSYFIRHAGAHDTLLQMGRWFGYRSGYEDLVRIHTTGPIISDFMDMVEIERELRSDIEEYENYGLSPVDFGVRVMKHMNNLNPTSKLKMGDVELRSHNEDKKIFETPNLDLDKPEILDSNLSALNEFISELLNDSQGSECGHQARSRIWKGVHPKSILKFLKNVEFNQSKNRMPIEQRIIPYILRRLEKKGDELRSWNVVSVGSSETEFSYNINSKGVEITLNGVVRTRVPDSNRVGASIAGPWDYISDLTEAPHSIQRDVFKNEGGGLDKGKMFEHRSKNEPLLLIYLLDPNSTPKNNNESSTRVPLFPKGEYTYPVLGLAMVLPKAEISASERNKEREYYIRLGAASLEDINKSRSENYG